MMEQSPCGVEQSVMGCTVKALCSVRSPVRNPWVAWEEKKWKKIMISLNKKKKKNAFKDHCSKENTSTIKGNSTTKGMYD